MPRTTVRSSAASLSRGIEAKADPAAGADPTPRGHLTEAAYQHVKALILDGHARPGERLDVNRVVADMSSSRQPVMTALRRLAAEGFVEIAPQSGCRVSRPDRRVITDFFRAFAAVEGVSAEIAAERAGRAALDDLARINTEILRLESGATQTLARARGYRRLNQAFHRRIHEIGGSGLLSGLAESFWDRADFYIATTIGLSPFTTRITTSFGEHERIIEAIGAGRSRRARRLMEAHILAFASAAET